MDIDYAYWATYHQLKTTEDVYRLYWDDMVYEWTDIYESAFPIHGEVTTQRFWDFAFVIDHVWDPAPGEQPVPGITETRVVGAFGLATGIANPKNRNIMKRYLGNSRDAFKDFGEEYDKGHFIAHRSGGPIDVNLFPQLRHINQGKSVEGKRYRQMERFVASHPGTFVFSRPIYRDLTCCPHALEFGYCTTEMEWVVEEFANR